VKSSRSSFALTNPLPIAQRPWRTWYNSAHWRRRRALQLRQHPPCVMCLAHGVTTPATIADHVVSHRGDWNAFILGELQSLCEPCHNRGKRLLDERGHTNDIDDDGWPTDPRHPAKCSGPVDSTSSRLVNFASPHRLAE